MPLRNVIRDAGFYLVTISIVLVYGAVGWINLPLACLFPVLYIFYVALVLYMERSQKEPESNEVEMQDNDTA